MKIKVSLHLHTKEDVQDGRLISYTIRELVDRAAVLGFKVLAVTGHDELTCTTEHVAYAKQKGILLLPSIEVCLGKKHLLVLNCDATAQEIKDPESLANWRQAHPQSFVLVPHPNHGMGVSLGLRNLRRHQELFDAVEHSWFYSRHLNPNKKVEKVCREIGKPFIATSDLHLMKYLDTDYAVLEVAEVTPQAVFAAIKSGHFQNVSCAKKIRDLAWFSIWMNVNELNPFKN